MEIRAPLSGVIVPLDAIPDSVFAKKLVGDGVSIDPTSCEVLSPISGTLTQLHHAHHALAITGEHGVEVLIHVGLDTVALRGRGFTPLVSLGARVEQGQSLLRFDPEVVARHARSLLTEVVVTTGELVAQLVPASGLAVAGQSVLLELTLRQAPVADVKGGAAGVVTSAPIRLPNPEGLHARPAAVLAARAKKFSAEVRLVRGADEANAKSIVAVMGLSTKAGEQVTLRASGVDAAQAVAELSALLAAGSGESLPAATPAAPAPAASAASTIEAPALAPRKPAVEGELSGDTAAPGVAIGRVLQHRRGALSVAEQGGTVAEERAKLATALREAALQLEGLRRQVGEKDRGQILGVHLELLEDPALVEGTEAGLKAGQSAAFAWHATFTGQAATLAKLDNALMKERAADLKDVGQRVLALLGGAAPTQLVLPEDAVLIAEELTPSEMASLDRGKLAALCTTTGSATSHVAILARSMGVPAICAIDEEALKLADGTRVVVDATAGVLTVATDERLVARAREQLTRQAARREEERAAAFGIGQTRDGHFVEVAANISNLEDARAAVAGGAEGVGLLRSEFMFYDRAAAPTEEEQAEAYLAMAEVLGKDRPFVVRTLDVGGDKPLGYLPLPKESNPFLGLRGIRVSLDRPQLFRAQLRAILRAAKVGNVHIMFPMISGLDEVRAAKAILAEEQGAGPKVEVEVGVMIEVPAAAVMAEALAREVDFFSIGTNDLTQYTLAMDRGHPLLAKRADALHPAVLRMIGMAVQGAHAHGKWVGVCGGIASDPLAVPVLVGLGVDELSVSVPAIGSIKATLSRWSLPECQTLALEVTGLATAAEVRARLLERQGQAPAPKADVRPIIPMTVAAGG